MKVLWKPRGRPAVLVEEEEIPNLMIKTQGTEVPKKFKKKEKGGMKDGNRTL